LNLAHNVRPSLFFYVLGVSFFFLMKSEVYERKVDTREELLAGTFHAATRTKKHEDQLRRTTRDLRTRGAKFIEVDGGIFKHLL
jgi:hypothetical protein